MNQTLNDLICELGTKKQVKVEYLLPKLRKIKKEIGRKTVDSFGNSVYIGDSVYLSDMYDRKCIEYAKMNHNPKELMGVIEKTYFSEGFIWHYALSVKAYKANPKKYNKLLGVQ